MSKTLITGAAGFIGSHLVRHLLEEGVSETDLRLFVFNDESLENLPDGKFDIYRGDIMDARDVERATEGIDVVYHLAALTNNAEGRYLEVNWKGTVNLLHACKAQKTRKFIFFSTIAVFGLPAFVGDKIDINEANEKLAIGEYALSKLKAEEEVGRAHKEWGLHYAIVRPTTVYGPRDKAGIYQLYGAIKNGYFFRIGNGKNKVDYVYVEDLVRGARKAELSECKAGEYILGANKPIAIKDLVDTVAKRARRKLSTWYVPTTLGFFLARICEIANMLLGTKIPLSVPRVKVLVSNFYCDSTKAKRELNYTPSTPLAVGIKETVNWIENEK